MLLHGGRSTQCPPQVAQFDWWAECVDNELVGPMARGVVGPMGLELPPTVQDGQEMMHEPVGLEPPPPEQDGLKMLHEGSPTRSPRPAPLEDHDADWWASMIASKLNYTGPVSRSPGGSSDLANSSVTVNNSVAICATPPGSPAPSTPVGVVLVNRLCIPLQTPAIHARPRMRKTKTSVSTIRRSLRLAAKPREADSTKQAQSILMKKLGTVVNSPAADSELIRKFRATFSEPPSASKHEAV